MGDASDGTADGREGADERAVGSETHSRHGSRAWLSVYLKGVAMGAADAIPGVSGGTIALITGIYERLIDAIAGVSVHGPDLVGDLLSGGNPSRRVAVKQGLRAMDVPFLVVLALGVLTGVVALANLVDLALDAFRAHTFAFFFGVILASPAVLRREISVRAPRPLAAGVAGFLLAYGIAGLSHRQAEYALPALFLIGAVAITAMVLPGISGSLVLLIVGAYDTMIGAVSDLTRAALGASGGATTDLVGPLSVLVVFAGGALVGVLTFARVVSWAIEAYRVPTMTFLVGVMLGALRTPYLEITRSVPAFTPSVVGSLVVAGAIGVLVVLALEHWTAGVE